MSLLGWEKLSPLTHPKTRHTMFALHSLQGLMHKAFCHLGNTKRDMCALSSKMPTLERKDYALTLEMFI